MSLAGLLGVAAAATVIAMVVWLVVRKPHPWMLEVFEHQDWSGLSGLAPLAPDLLLAPHDDLKRPIRCYDARVHASGLRVTMGVFESPAAEEAREFVARLMLESRDLVASGTQRVSIGGLDGVARTGWIRVSDRAGDDRDERGWGDTVANINWYFPEPNTARVHFVATFINPEQGQAASDLVHGLLAGARFARDSGEHVATCSLMNREQGMP